MKPAVAFALAAAAPFLALAQAPQAAQAEPPVPFILNILPVTDDLTRAEVFYHQLLGLESTTGCSPCESSFFWNAGSLIALVTACASTWARSTGARTGRASRL